MLYRFSNVEIALKTNFIINMREIMSPLKNYSYYLKTKLEIFCVALQREGSIHCEIILSFRQLRRGIIIITKNNFNTRQFIICRKGAWQRVISEADSPFPV